jgi:hypothetical protein
MAYDTRARENWHRYLHLKDRGHLVYMEQAKKCEGMYLGGGLQWSEEDKAVLRDEGRPFYEFNQVMPSINAALGHQIRNRMDISFKPRGGAGDLLKATALSKVTMQVADQNRLHWKETQVYGDGLIQQRGYYDIRMSFEKNILGEVIVDTLDPMDVIPDDGGKSYDPDGWADVTITRWLTCDEIGMRYGAQAKAKAEASGDDGPDWGEHDDERERNKFGTERMVGAQDAYMGDGSSGRRYRIIDRQFWVYERTRCLVYPDSGDVQIADQMRPEDVVAAQMQQGAQIAQLMQRRIFWVVSTYCASLFEGYSPYEHFTVVPFFAYFRRGITRGMVDNAIGPQEALNKGISQFIHVVNTSANSGWVIEENSLANMDAEDLETDGSRTGLVIEYRKGTKAPEKIKPNTVPTGIVEIVDRSTQMLKDVTVPDAMRGLQGTAVSGVAKANDQMASQQQMAVPLDNLAYTRYMVGVRILKLVQRFYDSYRVFRITETDLTTGQFTEKTLEINRHDPDAGTYWNDITVGTYDVVINETPTAVTFENSQFIQAMDMKKAGIAIPDSVIVKYSSLADKQDILTQMGNNPAGEAEAKLTAAKADVAQAQATKLNVEAIYSAIQTAQVIAMNPGVSPLADVVLGSGGFTDKNAPPLLPAPAAAAAGGPQGQPPTNTNPLTPARPAMPATPGVGEREGIETPAADAVEA